MTYEVKQKINMVVTYKGYASYSKPRYNGWGYDEVIINKLEDEEGTNLIWRTTTGHIVYDPTGNSDDWVFPNEGAKIRIKASVKSVGEYKGETQIELTRCKLVEIVEQAKTKEEIKEEKKEQQFQSIDFKAGDDVLTMTYKNYKEHYSDCETVIGSYKKAEGKYHPAMISVIVRAGRLVPSGVRGEHFNTYWFKNEEETVVSYLAVNKENATKRVNKEYPDHTWECFSISYWEPSEKYSY